MISRRHFLRNMLGVVAGAGVVGLPVWDWVAERRRVARFIRTMMGTDVEIVLVGVEPDVAAAAAGAAFGEMEKVADRFTLFDPGSRLNTINAAAGSGPVAVPADLEAVLAEATDMQRRSAGAFTPAIAPLSRLWAAGTVPAPETLDEAVEAVRRARVTISSPGRVYLGPSTRLDLGGIAKGYAVDRAVTTLRAMGVTEGIVNAGGDLRVLGSRGTEPWRVGIPDPARPDRIAQMLELRDAAVATSGDYQRYFVVDGVRYHHLIDPRTGYPATDARSFTVVRPDGVAADAASTAGFVLGADAGLQFVEGIGGQGLAMGRDGRWVSSPGLAVTAV